MYSKASNQITNLVIFFDQLFFLLVASSMTTACATSVHPKTTRTIPDMVQKEESVNTLKTEVISLIKNLKSVFDTDQINNPPAVAKILDVEFQEWSEFNLGWPNHLEKYKFRSVILQAHSDKNPSTNFRFYYRQVHSTNVAPTQGGLGIFGIPSLFCLTIKDIEPVIGKQLVGRKKLPAPLHGGSRIGPDEEFVIEVFSADRSRIFKVGGALENDQEPINACIGSVFVRYVLPSNK